MERERYIERTRERKIERVRVRKGFNVRSPHASEFELNFDKICLKRTQSLERKIRRKK